MNQAGSITTPDPSNNGLCDQDCRDILPQVEYINSDLLLNFHKFSKQEFINTLSLKYLEGAVQAKSIYLSGTRNLHDDLTSMSRDYVDQGIYQRPSCEIVNTLDELVRRFSPRDKILVRSGPIDHDRLVNLSSWHNAAQDYLKILKDNPLHLAELTQDEKKLVVSQLTELISCANQYFEFLSRVRYEFIQDGLRIYLNTGLKLIDLYEKSDAGHPAQKGSTQEREILSANYQLETSKSLVGKLIELGFECQDFSITQSLEDDKPWPCFKSNIDFSLPSHVDLAERMRAYKNGQLLDFRPLLRSSEGFDISTSLPLPTWHQDPNTTHNIKKWNLYTTLKRVHHLLSDHSIINRLSYKFQVDSEDQREKVGEVNIKCSDFQELDTICESLETFWTTPIYITPRQELLVKVVSLLDLVESDYFSPFTAQAECETVLDLMRIKLQLIQS